MDSFTQELNKAAQAFENLAKASPAISSKPQGDEMTKAEFQSVLTTLKKLGADGLRKALPKLSEPQLRMINTVLSKATSMDAEAVKQPENLKTPVREEMPRPKGGADEEDEKLVKEKNAEVKHQGDDSELSGQVIKSDAELAQVIARMKERKLAKADCMGALEQYGQSRTKMEKMWDGPQEAPKADAEAKPEEKKPEPEAEAKPAAKPEEKKPEDADAKADAAADKDVKEGLKQDDGFKGEKKPEDKPAALPEGMKDGMKKSVSWKEPIHPAHEALIKRGRNCHYNVDAAIATAEARTQEMKKSTWASDPYEVKAESLKKSEEKPKVTVNDLIEQKLDFAPGELELKKAQREWKPAGGFTVKSFSEKDMRFSSTEAPTLKKALPKGEGTRGGHIIGHTTTGKAIYADPKHPDHQHFTDEEHYDAHLANTMHQHAHEQTLMKPSTRGTAGKHVMAATMAQMHGKNSNAHMDKIKAKDLDGLHPHLKTMGDVMDHAKKVATSKFAPKEESQVSTKEAPEQKA